MTSKQDTSLFQLTKQSMSFQNNLQKIPSPSQGMHKSDKCALMYLHSDFKIVLYMSDQKTVKLETTFKHMANNEPTVILTAPQT